MKIYCWKKFDRKFQGGDENNLARGAWDWNFDWKRIPLNDREKATRKTISEPFRSPAMAGGLFAISTRWFEELGTDQIPVIK